MRENKDTYAGELRKALLVLHSPVDQTVSVQQAEKIFVSAMHPKSFVSLDNADHLLTKKQDAEYVATTIAGWASRYVLDADAAKPARKVAGGHLVVSERECMQTEKNGR